jgi:hypothetical protein
MNRDARLLQETAIALLVMTTIAAAFAGIFWLVTRVSPWPYVVFAELTGVGCGTALLALTSPARHG